MRMCRSWVTDKRVEWMVGYRKRRNGCEALECAERIATVGFG